MKSKTPVISCN